VANPLGFSTEGRPAGVFFLERVQSAGHMDGADQSQDGVLKHNLQMGQTGFGEIGSGWLLGPEMDDLGNWES
jgi:hypothetical protein